MLLMHQPSRRFVAVSHRRVRRSCLRHPFLQWSVCADRRAILKVWGVIWLFIAFIFFVLGVLVGILAFKVRRHGEDICCTALYLRAHRDVFCVRNRRLSKRRTRSISCPCRGRRTARALCRCCRRLSRCSSAPCRPHCSLGYDRRSARVRYVGL